MNKKILGVAVAAALTLSTFAASAEDMYRGAWYAVPSLNYMHADNDLQADSSGWGGALKVGKELSESWDIQGGLGYNTASEDTGVAGAGGRYKQTTLGLDALYMFSRDKFRPFLLAGLGAARNRANYSGVGITNGNRTSWLGELGLGAQYLFSDNFGIQADLREQWSRGKTQPTPNAGNVDANGTIANTLLGLGGIFRFGAPAPVVAEAAPEPAPMPIAEPAPEPAPAPAPAPVVCTPKTETITVGAEKLFGFNKHGLKSEGKAALDEAAAKIKASPEIKAVIVTGYTDRIGSDAYNQKLSERRAKEVADYLAAQGVDSSIITSEGKGKANPVVECPGKKVNKKLISCLQPNRRVEIRAEGQKETGCN
jgi:OmpA-OmpF porin, OOP family